MQKTMNALVYHGPGRLCLEHRELREPRRGEVLLKIRYCAVCGSDVGAYRTASDRFAPPLILGHEFSATVVQLGEGVDSLQVGQQVCGNPPIYCGTCWFCTHGRYNLCPNRLSLGNSVGVAKCDGTLAEYIALPAFALIPLSDGVGPKEGSLMEPLAVGLHAAKTGGFVPGETVAVIGTGPIGLMTILSLQAVGAGHIIGVDLSDARLEAARMCGAHDTVNPRQRSPVEAVRTCSEGRGADRVIICTGSAPAFYEAIAMTRSAGSVVLVGMIQETVPFCPMDIFSRGIDLVSSYTFTDEIYEAVELVHRGNIDLHPLISSVYPLNRAKEAFDLLVSPDHREIKVLIEVGG